MASQELLVTLGLTSNSFQKKMREILKEVKQLDSELEEANSSVKDFAKTQEGVAAKLAYLEKKMKILNTTTELYSEEQERLTKELKESQQAFETFGKELNDVKIKYDRYNSSLEKTTQNYTESQNNLKNLQNAYKSIDKEIKTLEKSLSKELSAYEKMQTQQIKNADNLKKLENRYEGLTNVLNKQTESYEKSNKKLKETEDKIDSLKNAIKVSSQVIETSSNDIERLTKEVARAEEAYGKTANVTKRFTQELKEAKQIKSLAEKEVAKLNSQLQKAEQTWDKTSVAISKQEAALNKTSQQIKELEAKLLLANNKLKDFSQQMDNSAYNIKETQNELSRLRNNYSQLGQAIEVQKNKINEAKNAINSKKETVEELSTELSRLEKEYTNTQKQISSTASKLKTVNAEFAAHKAQINKVNLEIEETNRKMASIKWDNLSEKFNNMSNGLNTVGNSLKDMSSLFAPASLAITGLGTAVIKTGTTFQEQMSRVSSLTGKTGKELETVMGQLTESARLWGSQTNYSATEAAQGLEYLILAGYDAEQAMESLPLVLKTAQAGAMDLGIASDLLTDSLASLGDNSEFSGDKLKDLDTYANQVARTSTRANATIQQLLESFVTVGGQVDNMNIPLSTANTLLGILADQGIKSSEAGRSLSSILINLTQTTGQSADAMEALGVSAFDAQGKMRPIEKVLYDIKKSMKDMGSEKQEIILSNMLGGKEQAKTLQKLLNGISLETKGFTTHYQELKEEIEKAPDTKAVENMSKVMTDNLQGDFDNLLSTIEESFLSVFETIEPILREFTQSAAEGVRELTEWFKELDEDTQKNILKFAALTAVIAPLLAILGSLFTGLASILSVGGLVSKGIGGLSGKFATFNKTLTTGNTAGNIATISTKLSGLKGVLSGGWTALLVLSAAFVGLGVTMGDNIKALDTLEEKFGSFGEHISVGLEVVNGSIGTILENIGLFIKAIPRLFESFKFGGETPADVWNQVMNEMTYNTKVGSSRVNGEMSSAMEKLKTMTSSQGHQMSMIFNKVLEGWVDSADDNGKKLSTVLANRLDGLDQSTVETLRGTSESMAVLFDGIYANMNKDEAIKKFQSNIKVMAESGRVDIATLRNDFSKALGYINKNFNNSGELIEKESKKIFNSLKGEKTLEEAARSISTQLDNMSIDTLNSLRDLGSNWRWLFRGISEDDLSNGKDLTKTIKKNLQELAKDENYLENFKTQMKTGLEEIKTVSEEKMNEIGETLKSKGVEGGDKIIEGLKEGTLDIDKAFEGLDEEGQLALIEALGGLKETANTEGKEVGKNIGQGTSEGTKEGLLGLSENVKAELAKAGVTVDEEGKVVVENMTEQARKAGKSYVDTLNKELPQLSSVSKNIQDQLAGIDSIRLGNVTKQLSEINRWLGVVRQTAIETNIHMTALTILKWGNTTKGLSEVNKWLNTVSTTSTSTKNNMTQLTRLPFGNTTKGLSEINQWLMRTTNRSKDTATALKNITKVTFGSTTKGLSEINKWLTTCKTGANNVQTALQNIKSVTFGSTTKGLSEINRWLNTIAGTSKTAQLAISTVKNASRSISLPSVEQPQVPDYNTFMPRTDLDISRFKTSGGWYSPQSMGQIAPQTTTVQEPDNLMKTTLEAVMQQNQLLLQLLGADRNINVNVIAEGRNIASATAPFMVSEIDKITRRKNRLGGK